MKEIRTEIQINASASAVWNVLTDFRAYPDWNPFMVYLKGKPAVGERIEVKMVPPGSKGMVLNQQF